MNNHSQYSESRFFFQCFFERYNGLSRMLRCQSRQKHYAESGSKSFDFYCYNNVCDKDDDADDGDNDYVNYYHSDKVGTATLMRMTMTTMVVLVMMAKVMMVKVIAVVIMCLRSIKHFSCRYKVISTRVKIAKTTNCLDTRVFSLNSSFSSFQKC